MKESGIDGQQTEEFSASLFRDDVIEGEPDRFMQRLSSLVSTLNLDPRGNMEAHYQNAVYLVFTLMGFTAGLEVHSAKGRSDMTVITSRYVYIFEFKTDSSSRAALDQIDAKGYAEPYLASGKAIFKIGVNFDTATRSLMPWLIERI